MRSRSPGSRAPRPHTTSHARSSLDEPVTEQLSLRQPLSMGIMDLGDIRRAIARGHSFSLSRGILVAGSLACSGCSGSCGPCPPTTLTRDLTDELRFALGDDIPDQAACQNICNSGNTLGRIDDSGTSDAGPRFDGWGIRWTCELDDPVVRCAGFSSCGEGRAPQALRHPATRRAGSRVGAHFASVAHLEAAAVPAFFELASEMNLHGAPHAMSRAARHSARQEIVHARLVGRLARRFGGEVPVVQRGETAPRSLFDMAKDNAFEGCVREAYGALLAAHQATHARDPDVRSVFARIAKDEAEHALLSLALHDWARSRVSDAERRVLDETRDQGVASLHTTVTAEEPDRALALAGLPSATAAHDLARALVA